MRREAVDTEVDSVGLRVRDAAESMAIFRTVRGFWKTAKDQTWMSFSDAAERIVLSESGP